jgi:hypothetical protein
VTDLIQPYGTFSELAPNLFVLDGEWYNTPFKRRMTVIRLTSGDLVIHSAIRLKSEDYDHLDRLGKVRYIIIPNAFHGSDARFYSERYPQARVLASRAVKPNKKTGRVDGILPKDWPQEMTPELECLEMEGTRLLGEILLFHKSTRTLVVTDIVFNMQQEPHGLIKMIFKWNLIYKRFGPSRIFGLVFANNRSRIKSSLEKVFEMDFDRVIMNHGEILHAGGKPAMQKGFETYLA